MAKKKARGAPTRTCETCGARYHPRQSQCPECGTPNPTAGRKKKVVRKIKRRGAKAKAKKRRKAAARAGDPLDAAITFINSVGGVGRAKAVIARIEQIRGL